jgi:hypothetical protein
VSRLAKAYIGGVIISGALVLLLAIGSWSPASISEFAAFLGFTLFASTLKVRIPGMTGTMSPNFIFLLIGMVLFSLPEVVATAFGAAILQCIWRPKLKLQMVQVSFSAAALVVSSALSFMISHFLVAKLGTTSTIPLLLLAGILYLSINTMLVSVVLSLVERHSFEQVFQRCYEWVLPYFVSGIFLTGLLGGSAAPSRAWQTALPLVPAALLAYLYFRGRSEVARQQNFRQVDRGERNLIGIASDDR